MSELSGDMLVQLTPFRFIDRVATLASLAVACGLFLSVGWMAMAPDDPEGPITIWARRGGLMMLAQAAGLAMVASGVASMLVGRRLMDVGPFVASLGLAIASLRGSTTARMLLAGEDAAPSFAQRLAWKFVVESIGWMVVILTAVVIAGLVMRWLYGRFESDAGVTISGDRPTLTIPAAFDAGHLSQSRLGISHSLQTTQRHGLLYCLLIVIVGLAAMRLLSAGLSQRAILPGQVWFVVAASFFIAVYVANRVVIVRSVLWGILGVGLAAILAYAWAAMNSGGATLPPGIPPSVYLRILPIQFTAIGTASVIVAYWYTFPHDVAHGEQVSDRNRQHDSGRTR